MNRFVPSFFMSKCYMCDGKIDNSNSFICDKCIKKLEKYKYKYNDLKINKYIDFLFVFEYKEIIRKLIISYKFLNKSYLSKVFIELILYDKKIYRNLKKYDIILSVPMSKKSKKIRGYNQVDLIANALAKNLGISYFKDFFLKVKNNKRQSSLNKIDRKENVKDVFRVNNKYNSKYYKDFLNNKSIIILDDIYTTGSTINEIIKVLKKNMIDENYKIKNILVLILAKD